MEKLLELKKMCLFQMIFENNLFENFPAQLSLRPRWETRGQKMRLVKWLDFLQCSAPPHPDTDVSCNPRWVIFNQYVSCGGSAASKYPKLAVSERRADPSSDPFHNHLAAADSFTAGGVSLPSCSAFNEFPVLRPQKCQHSITL